MIKKFFSTLKILTFAMVLSVGLSYVYAWTAPTETSPNGNVSAPLNTSSTAQTKAGNLTVSATTTSKYFVDFDNLDLSNPAYFVKPAGLSTFWRMTSVNKVTAKKLKIPGGTAGAILTSDGEGNAYWYSPPVTLVSPLWAWGENDRGQLGDGTVVNRDIPTKINSSTSWKSVSAGGLHTVAIKSDGTLWAWGENMIGQLGDGTTTDRNSPTKIDSNTDWLSISSGGLDYKGDDLGHTLAIRSGGTLWVWGSNVRGQLGDGTMTPKTSPKKIGTDTNWQSVSAGGEHSVAIKSDGTLWAWGDNGNGQLGDGTNVDKSTPTKIGSSTNWQSVSAGDYFTHAIKTDGTLWAWGKNSEGALGIGTTIDISSPTKIGADTNWQSVSGGKEFALAIKTDGTIWSWGKGSSGQLGDGTEIGNRSFPAKIGSDTNWQLVSTGKESVVAIKSDGTLWIWGLNSQSALGGGSGGARSIPSKIGSGTNWKKVSAGGKYSIAIEEKPI